MINLPLKARYGKSTRILWAVFALNADVTLKIAESRWRWSQKSREMKRAQQQQQQQHALSFVQSDNKSSFLSASRNMLTGQGSSNTATNHSSNAASWAAKDYQALRCTVDCRGMIVSYQYPIGLFSIIRIASISMLDIEYYKIRNIGVAVAIRAIRVQNSSIRTMRILNPDGRIFSWKQYIIER